MEPTLNDIDEMIVHEKMQAALEYQTEAWADGMADGIEPEIIAEAALVTALVELLRSSDEPAALALMERMRDRVIAGEFAPNQSRH